MDFFLGKQKGLNKDRKVEKNNRNWNNWNNGRKIGPKWGKIWRKWIKGENKTMRWTITPLKIQEDKSAKSEVQTLLREEKAFLWWTCIKNGKINFLGYFWKIITSIVLNAKKSKKIINEVKEFFLTKKCLVHDWLNTIVVLCIRKWLKLNRIC